MFLSATPSGTTLLNDQFTSDAALNTSLWQLNGPTATTAGENLSSPPATIIQPQLSFSNSTGMDMLMTVNASGATPVYEADMIQSIQSFSGPFTAQAQVTGIVSHGNTFVFMVYGSNSSNVEIMGNLNPGNGPYYGINEEQNFNQQLIQLVSNPSVNTPYTLSVGVDVSGNTTLTVASGGQSLATTSGNNLGTGPFYVLIGQLEGYPYTAGNNDAQWQYAKVTGGGVTGTSPTAAVTTPNGKQEGYVTINYSLTDANSDPVNILAQYSLDGGITWQTASEGSGDDGTTGLTSSPSGTSHTFFWDSDHPGNGVGNVVNSNVEFRITPTATDGTGPAATTSPFTVDDVAPSLTVNTPSGTQNGNVTINYTVTDSVSDPVNIQPYYSTNGGSTWNPATAAGGDGITNLSSSPGGTGHTFIWASGTDLPNTSATVMFSFSVVESPGHPGSYGAGGQSGAFAVNNMQTTVVPSAAITSPINGTSGWYDNIGINYTLSDANADACTILAQYSTDGGTTWNTAAKGSGGDGTTGLKSSAVGTPHTFIWAGVSDLVSYTTSLPVEFRITPSSQEGLGSAGTTSFAFDTAALGLTPAMVRHYYGFDQLSYNGYGQTIAIVDPGYDPNIWNNLQQFDSAFDLQNMSKASGIRLRHPPLAAAANQPSIGTALLLLRPTIRGITTKRLWTSNGRTPSRPWPTSFWWRHHLTYCPPWWMQQYRQQVCRECLLSRLVGEGPRRKSPPQLWIHC